MLQRAGHDLASEQQQHTTQHGRLYRDAVVGTHLAKGVGHSLQFVTYVCLERHPINTECQPGSQTILQLSLVRTRHLLYKNRGEELLEHLPRSLHLHVKERLCSNSCLGLPSIPLVRELPLLIHWGSCGLLITGPLLLDHRTVTYSILESPYRRDKQVQNATGAKTPM